MIAIAIAGSITAAVAAGLALSGGDRKLPGNRNEPLLPRVPEVDEHGNVWRPELIRTERAS